MDSSLQIADAFSVDDADLQNALLPAGIEICPDDIFDFARRKGVQVQNTVDRQLHWLAKLVIRVFHDARITRSIDERRAIKLAGRGVGAGVFEEEEGAGVVEELEDGAG